MFFAFSVNRAILPLIFYISRKSHDYGAKDEHNGKKSEIQCRENGKVFSHRSAVARILLKRYEACERSYHGTCSADIDTDKKLPVILRKLREQYCGRDIADKLTGKDGKNERILFEKGG